MHGKDGKVFNAFFATGSTVAAMVGAVVSKPMPIIIISFRGLDSDNSIHSSAEETTRTSAPAARLFWRLSPFVPGTLEHIAKSSENDIFQIG